MTQASPQPMPSFFDSEANGRLLTEKQTRPGSMSFEKSARKEGADCKTPPLHMSCRCATQFPIEAFPHSPTEIAGAWSFLGLIASLRASPDFPPLESKCVSTMSLVRFPSNRPKHCLGPCMASGAQRTPRPLPRERRKNEAEGCPGKNAQQRQPTRPPSTRFTPRL